MKRYSETRKPRATWPRSQAALALIAASSGITRSALAAAMGCKPATVAIYCHALRVAGLARCTGVGRGSRWVTV